MQVKFGSSRGISVLESPFYGIAQQVCLTFYYQISSANVWLDVLSKEKNTSDFTLTGTLTYANQTDSDQWNFASLLLKGGVAKIQFKAIKRIVTQYFQFINIDRVSLNTRTANCTVSGESVKC